MWKEIQIGDAILEGIDVSQLSRDEWQQVRGGLEGVGGSEISTILGLNKWKDPIRLFYEKAGIIEPKPVTADAASGGRFFERSYTELYHHWGGSVSQTYANWDAGIQTRKTKYLSWIIRNPQFPYMFANIDNLILEHPTQQGLGISEIKGITGRSAAAWEAGYPPGYPKQVIHYATILEVDYGELFVYQELDKFQCVLVVPSTEEKAAQIVAAKDFMARVIEAKERVKGMRSTRKMMELVQDLEPQPSSSEDYKQFMTEKHLLLEEGREDIAPDQVARWIELHAKSKAKEDYYKTRRTYYENKTKHYMDTHNLYELNDGSKSKYVRWIKRFTNKWM